MAHRSVIVTGAAGGVGSACARRFAENGDRLILADIDEKHGRALAEEIVDKGGAASFVHADVSNRLHVHNIVAEALEAYGRIDVLAHAAMLRFSAPFLSTTEEEFDRVIAVNLHGAFLITQAVAKQLVSQFEGEGGGEAGVIVNIGTVDAVTASADHAAFAASQGGLQQMTRAAALALSPYGVRANAVGVGAIKSILATDDARRRASETVPLRRAGDPEEVAEVVFFLASQQASYVTGQCLYVDGGRLAQTISSEDENSSVS